MDNFKSVTAKETKSFYEYVPLRMVQVHIETCQELRKIRYIVIF
jgi:hypothetical protein